MNIWKCTHPLECPTCHKTDECGTRLTILDENAITHFRNKHPEHHWSENIEVYFKED